MNNNNEVYTIYSIGQVTRSDSKTFLNIDACYKPALKQLEHFSHIQVLWWINEFDDAVYREILQGEPPYENAPMSGVFATRSPVRPNPIGLTVCKILYIDYENGTIEISGIDAYDNSSIIDIKAYIPICDRVKDYKVPSWIEHWPEWFPTNGLEIEE